MLFKIRCMTLSLIRGFRISTVNDAVSKADLSKLRKKTGFSFVNCKKALQQCDNNLVQAEKWLRDQAQKEGWTKASKLQQRAMAQGLVGLLVDSNSAALVEVNCETDFVARNDKFQKLVSEITNASMQHAKQIGSDKVLLNKEAVDNVTSGSRKLADLVAMEIGNLGENMSIRRGVYLHVSDGLSLSAYIHSAGAAIPVSGQCQFGRYGAIVIYEKDPRRVKDSTSTGDIGQQLAQHIVGMNPKSLGLPDDEPNPVKDEETSLLLQEFLLEPSLTVKEYLDLNGTRVYDFCRIECGEEIEGEE